MANGRPGRVHHGAARGQGRHTRSGWPKRRDIARGATSAANSTGCLTPWATRTISTKQSRLVEKGRPAHASRCRPTCVTEALQGRVRRRGAEFGHIDTVLATAGSCETAPTPNEPRSGAALGAGHRMLLTGYGTRLHIAANIWSSAQAAGASGDQLEAGDEGNDRRHRRKPMPMPRPKRSHRAVRGIAHRVGAPQHSSKGDRPDWGGDGDDVENLVWGIWRQETPICQTRCRTYCRCRSSSRLTQRTVLSWVSDSGPLLHRQHRDGRRRHMNSA